MKRIIISMNSTSAVDLADCGPSRFINDPSFQLRLVLTKWENQLITWRPDRQECPDQLRDALEGADEIWSPNGTIARLSLAKAGIHPALPRWRCMSALLSLSALPSEIKTAATALGIDMGMSTAARLIAEKGTTTSAALIADMSHDIKIMKGILDRIRDAMPPPAEWDLYAIDQAINGRGLPVDRKANQAAVRIAQEVEQLLQEDIRKLTGQHNPGTAEFLSWLRSAGYRGRDMRRSSIEAALETAKTPRLRRGLELRLASSRSSTAKFAAIERAVDIDDRLRHVLKFAGASRTSRWSGQIYQPQNLVNPPALLEDKVEEIADNIPDLDAMGLEMIYGSAPDALAACVRPVIKPIAKEHVIIDADLSSIEHAVLGYVTGDIEIQRIYQRGLDPYLVYAADYFGGTYEEHLEKLRAGDKFARKFSKPPVLGGGFGLGPGKQSTATADATGLLGYAGLMGVIMSPAQAEKAVTVYRKRHAGVVKFWRDIERAVSQVIRHEGSVHVRSILVDMPCPDHFRIILPSGRAIHYWFPEIRQEERNGRTWDSISYMHYKDGNWQRTSTYGGKLTENIVQAIARDILANGLRLAHEGGLQVFLHVHDQIVAESHISSADADLATLIECMTALPHWADETLHLAASGQITRRFRKD